MLSLLKVLLQFALTASDPRATCELVHRDAGVAGTYYLYCSQTTPGGLDVISVGRFVPDALPGEEGLFIGAWGRP